MGICTGMTGVRIGMGPVPPTEPERRAEGFEEGVRRIVATPGVTMTGPWPVEQETEALWNEKPGPEPPIIILASNKTN